VFDHDEDVEAAQEHGVDVGEVDRNDRAGLRGEELSPGRSGPSRRQIEPSALKDRPDGRGGHGMAKADQLALVGAENPVTSCHLHVFVDEPAEPISPERPDGSAGTR
jgi:hypothetical protein